MRRPLGIQTSSLVWTGETDGEHFADEGDLEIRGQESASPFGLVGQSGDGAAAHDRGQASPQTAFHLWAPTISERQGFAEIETRAVFQSLAWPRRFVWFRNVSGFRPLLRQSRADLARQAAGRSRVG